MNREIYSKRQAPINSNRDHQAGVEFVVTYHIAGSERVAYCFGHDLGSLVAWAISRADNATVTFRPVV